MEQRLQIDYVKPLKYKHTQIVKMSRGRNAGDETGIIIKL